MPKIIKRPRGTPDGTMPNSKKKRGRPATTPTKLPVPLPYPPPPPPPPPPANNPYYQKFFEEYWKKYATTGYQSSAGMPPPPPGISPAHMMAVPAVPALQTIALGGPGRPANPPIPPVPATKDGPPREEYPVKTDRKTFVLATPDDVEYLSEKHCYVRTRLAEIFLSEQTDVDTPVRGRRASFKGQVGLRCVFCVPAIESRRRVERAICYPTTTAKFYQTAQDMQHFHFVACPAIPPEVKAKYQSLRGNMNNRRSSGGGGEKDRETSADNRKMSPKDFWVKCCADLGLIDHIGDDGSNAGVKLKEGHGLVERARLPEYAKELYMPPEEEKEENEDVGADADKMAVEEGKIGKDGEMEQVLAEEVEVGDKGGKNEGFDELVADLDGDEKAEGDDAEEDGDGEGEDAGEDEDGEDDDAEEDGDMEVDDAEEDEDGEDEDAGEDGDDDDAEDDGDVEVDDAEEDEDGEEPDDGGEIC